MDSNLKPCRIVLTGGPGAGKTTAAALLRREIGKELVVVPEAATMLFAGGFPRYTSGFAIKATQKAIYHVQRNLEDVQTAQYPDRVLLCDRGTVDSSIYWPDGSENFFSELGTELKVEFSRYEAVVFLETAAVGNIDIEGNNPIRRESLNEAIDLDRRLKGVWERHPNFYFIPHENSFMKKINKAHELIQQIIQFHQR